MPLSDQEIQAGLDALPDWALVQGKLSRTFDFPNFVEALAFVNRVGALAEQQNHHPDVEIRDSRVTLGLISHDVNAITRRDLRLARLIDESL